MDAYHIPVLAKECMDGLNILEDGIYVDATFGGGGHSKLILEQLGEDGQLFAFDQDEDALANRLEDKRFELIQNNFRYIRKLLRLHGVRKVDGILADLGVSSHQFDEAKRGFSYRFDTSLDMRMNQQQEQTAGDILNTESAKNLQDIFSHFGEVRNARSLANLIVKERAKKNIRTVGDLLLVIEPLIRGHRNRYLAQVFQALRIVVNDEVAALTEFLQEALEVLKPGGRLVIISYHSIEDRLVKRFFKTGNVEGQVIKDDFGNIHRPFNIITKKAVLPEQEEIRQNSRAKSAKMRIAQKKINNDE